MLRAKQVYRDEREKASDTSTPLPPERRSVLGRRIIEEAKEKIPTVDLAERLCGPDSIRRVGKEWLGRCPLPDHEDKTPSFTVNPEKNLWFCHGCGRGGDVVDLARFAWGYEKREVAMAAADLLHEFGHPIPERPESWYRKQARQRPVRNGIEAAKIHVARRRLYRRFFEPLILATVDEDDRKHDEQLFWERTLPLAEHLVGHMMAGQR
jgi:DNA primase